MWTINPERSKVWRLKLFSSLTPPKLLILEVKQKHWLPKQTMASRLGQGFRGASRRCSFQSTFKPSFSSNYTRFASASSFTQSTSTPTITMSYPQSFSAMTPQCMVYSAIRYNYKLYTAKNPKFQENYSMNNSLTQTMEEGSHLIGSGSTSSALAGYWMTVLYFVKFLEITMYATNLYTYMRWWQKKKRKTIVS